jgi:riboflavin synthase
VFTGIVEEIGEVRSSRRISGGFISGGARIEIAASAVLSGTRVGDSIAVNGACQTVVALGPDCFAVEALGETLRKTTLGGLRPGNRVHLERALALGGRLGGHLVQGHVNGVARVRNLRREGENVYLVLSLPEDLERCCIAEGSIAVDGVSLTICTLRPGEVEVNLIPHTRSATLLGEAKRGDEVNIENDLIAKYVERLLTFRSAGNGYAAGGPADAAAVPGAPSLETLLNDSF